MNKYVNSMEIVNNLIEKPYNDMKAAEKGILVVPVEVIPDDMDIETFAKEWAKYIPTTKVSTIQFIPLDENTAKER